jgi:hypothetical protein
MRTPVTIAAACVLAAGACIALGAQATGGAQMPDARRMSGIPLPVADLAPGTVTVRVVRGSITNVVADQPVELSGGASPLVQKTNVAGRAEFSGLTPGTRVKAATTLDGERIESQEFEVPRSGGIRIALVAAGAGGAAAAPVRDGGVVFGDQSRFVFELGDEALSVFYVLQIVNSAEGPVRTAVPLVFDLPKAAQGAGMLEGSSPQAKVAGTRVTVAGPFAPGTTLVQLGYSLPYSGGDVTLQQKLPTALDHVAVVAEKGAAGMRLQSPQFSDQREMPVEGQTYIVGKGPLLRAGGTLTFNFTGLPHQPVWPRNVALALALAVLAGGAWGMLRRAAPTAGEEARRRALQNRRDRLFTELTSLEAQHRDGTLDPAGYADRRRTLVEGLERVYAEMDEEAAA